MRNCANREIAAIVGVEETTVRREKTAANAAPDEKTSNETTASESEVAANAALLDAIPAAAKQQNCDVQKLATWNRISCSF
jgi:hypothetical protein